MLRRLESVYTSEEGALFRSFPFVMLVAAAMLVITARTNQKSHAMFLWTGLLTGAAYVAIWMFNGKRSHSLIGLLATVCLLSLAAQAAFVARFNRHRLRWHAGRVDCDWLERRIRLPAVGCRVRAVSR